MRPLPQHEGLGRLACWTERRSPLGPTFGTGGVQSRESQAVAGALESVLRGPSRAAVLQVCKEPKP